jgi:CHASE2 domain-containing sensor protein
MIKFIKKLFNADCLASTILVFVAMVLLPLILSFHFFIPLKNAFYDFAITDINYAKLRSPEKELADTNIVLIDISGMSNNELAEMIDILNENKPKVIGIDKELKLESDSLANLRLAGALKKVNRLVLSNRLIYKKIASGVTSNADNKKNDFDSIAYSPRLFSQYSIAGFTNQITIKDKSHETVRTFKTFTKVCDSVVYPFPVEVVNMYDPQKVKYLYQRNNKEEIINFRGYFNKYFFIAGSQVLNNEFNPNLFSGKILLLSYFDPFRTSSLFAYKYYSPLEKEYTGKSFPDMSGIEIHANVISMILNENYFNIVPSWIAVLIAFIFCYFTIFLYIYIDEKISTWYELLSLVIFVVESMLFIIANYESYHHMMLDLNLDYSLFAIILASPLYEAFTKSLKPLILGLLKKKA